MINQIFLKRKFETQMLTVLHIFRNKEKALLNLEYFADNKPNKTFFVQFGKKIIGPKFLVHICQNEITCAVSLEPRGNVNIS